MNAPCKDCEKKGCGYYHSQCERYRRYREEKDKEKEARIRERFLQSLDYKW